MSDADRAHRLIFQRYSAAQFENAFKRIRKASKLPLGAAVKQRLIDGLYKAQKNILVFAIDADLALFKRGTDTSVKDNVLYHDLGKEKLAELRRVLGDPQAVKAFIPDGDTHTDSQRAYTFYCETILGEGFRLPHLWSESGRFRNFKTRNPMAIMLLQKVFNNYVGNLVECLQRVSADIAALQACFLGGRPIRRIAKVTASGSDSQRGGKQVLFLDLETDDPDFTRVVYKPSDVEIDFLLVGSNSGAVNDFLVAQKDDPGYPRPSQSLFELVNTTLEQSEIDDSETSRPLSTYVILPRNPGSRFSPQQMAPPIRDSYGYLEFLSFAPKPPEPPFGTGDTLFDMFTSHPDETRPPAPRDWIVDDDTEAAACMRNWGRISTLACVMLMRDLHHENRRLRNANPTLIDLEMTGTGKFKNSSESGLFLQINQNAHSSRGEQVIRFSKDLTGPVTIEKRAGIPVWGLDQLYLSTADGRPGRYWRFDTNDALADIRQGMLDVFDVLNPAALKSWLTKVGMGQVIVRFLSLQSFNEFIEEMLRDLVANHTPLPTPEAAMEAYVGEQLKIEQKDQIVQWVQSDFPRQMKERAFVFETPEGVGEDLLNLDLPRFYRRMNGRTILNSSGSPMTFETEYHNPVAICENLRTLFRGRNRKYDSTGEIEGYAPSEVAKEMQFHRFIETTGLDDVSKAISQRLGLDEKAKLAQVDTDIRWSGIVSQWKLAELFGGKP